MTNTAFGIVLSKYDLPSSSQGLVHNCEDCACAVTSAGVKIEKPSALDSLARLSYIPHVIETNLDDNFWALFNPFGDHGVVVVNNAVFQALQELRSPFSFKDVIARMNPSMRQSIEQLIEMGVIQPIDLPTVPLQFQSSDTLIAWLHITNDCNLQCPYCYIKKSNAEMSEPTGHAAIKALVNAAKNHQFKTLKLKYAGGEASLNYDLVLKLHDYARELADRENLQLGGVFLSNGVSFSSKLIAALKQRDIRVMISVDGIGSYHDSQRPLRNGEPSFHLVERTINLLIKEEYPPHISITITNRNMNGLADIVRFALERHLTFSFNFFRDNANVEKGTDLNYDDQHMIDRLLTVFSFIETDLPAWSLIGSLLDRGQLVQPRQRSCGAGHDYVVINPLGQIAKCHMEIERVLGNVFVDDPLLAVRNDSIGFQNYCVDDREECKNCRWRYWCSGGCPITTFKASARYDYKSPNCEIYKTIFPEALRLEGLRILKYAPNNQWRK